MDYTVTHITRFQYDGPVHESVMEVRLHPRQDRLQDVQRFEITTDPAAAVFRYADELGNDVHHFDIIAPHQQLVIQTQARVRTRPALTIPESVDPSAWHILSRMRASGQLWDFFEPSPRVPASPAVHAFADACRVVRAADPLTCFRCVVSAVYGALAYAPESTNVDTPIATVLETRRGVCQDFAHVTLAIARVLGIPCRYVSGYFAPTGDQDVRQSLTSHAWVEAWLPGLEWIALDPTHNIVAGERHISVAVGRDYTDAAPTRGVFRGGPARTLVAYVHIEQGTGFESASEQQFPPPPVIPARPSMQRDQ